MLKHLEGPEGLVVRDRLEGLLFKSAVQRPPHSDRIVVIYYAPLERAAGLGGGVSVPVPARTCPAYNRIPLISEVAFIFSTIERDGCGG